MKTPKYYLLFTAVLSAVWLAGCSTPATRIRNNPEMFARLNPDQQALVKAGQVGIGMDMSAVVLAVGKPDRITVRTNAEGQTQVWRYVEYAYYSGGFLHSGLYGAEEWAVGAATDTMAMAADIGATVTMAADTMGLNCHRRQTDSSLNSKTARSPRSFRKRGAKPQRLQRIFAPRSG